MNTEQRERAEAMVEHYVASSVARGRYVHPINAIEFALDFHKQELQRIGEVYVACTFSEAELYAGTEAGALPLKKLSLLEVKDLEASDNNVK